MKRVTTILMLISAIGLAASAGSPDQNAPTAKAPAAGVLKLVTGQEVKGVVEEATLVIQSPYGELKVPVHCVASLRSEAPERPAIVELNTGERFIGRITAPGELAIQIEVGRLLVPVARIASLEQGGPRPAFGCVELPGARHADAIYAIPDRPGEVLVFTENVGATCGGGTPATVWRATFAASRDARPTIEKVQTLTAVQQIRQIVFRSSDGTLFTGAGWGGPTPPYYSTDGGKSFKPANAGGHPPNSTFSFCELKGRVYAGTGYEPYHGQVYRWLGEGKWERVLDVAPPRSIIGSMVVHEGRMFVAAEVYWASVSGGSAAVYVSTDGDRFHATTGIPDTHSIRRFAVAGGKLLAFGDEAKIYCWNGEQWESAGEYPEGINPRSIIVADRDGETTRGPGKTNVLYAGGKLSRDSTPGVYASSDLGKTWKRIASLPADVRSMTACGRLLYVGTSGQEGKVLPQVVRIKLDPAAGP